MWGYGHGRVLVCVVGLYVECPCSKLHREGVIRQANESC